jgi:hypothetical protein
LKISYAFTCGRLETIFKILNHRKNGQENNVVEEQRIVEQYRDDVLSKRKKIEDTELFQYLQESEDKIVQNRLNRAFKENNGLPTDDRFGNEYRSGIWNEFEEYKLAERLTKAKSVLQEKHLRKTGMEITSRDIATMTGFSSSNIRNMLAHKKAVVLPMLEKIEKYADSY